METIKKEIEIFKAIDGNEFTTRTACVEYETTHKQSIRAMFDAIPNNTFRCSEADYNLSEESDYRVVYPQNYNDIVTINMCIRYYGNDKTITPDMIGVGLVFYINYDGDVYYEMTLEEKINTYKKAFEFSNNEH